MFAHVANRPVRLWLQAGAAETGTMGYSRVGSMEVFHIEAGAPLLVSKKIIECPSQVPMTCFVSGSFSTHHSNIHSNHVVSHFLASLFFFVFI